MIHTANPFNNFARVDDVDTTQNNLDNSRYAGYMLSDFNGSKLSTDHVRIATSQPDIMFSSLGSGAGLSGDVVDNDSAMRPGKDQARPLEKVQLFQRPFISVPYMGKGAGNPVLESRLLQGESTVQFKSVGTVMEQSFLPFSILPVDDLMQQHVADPRFTVEEAALQGWVRGGSTTRD